MKLKEHSFIDITIVPLCIIRNALPFDIYLDGHSQSILLRNDEITLPSNYKQPDFSILFEQYKSGKIKLDSFKVVS
jgi:hypothetical protein